MNIMGVMLEEQWEAEHHQNTAGILLEPVEEVLIIGYDNVLPVTHGCCRMSQLFTLQWRLVRYCTIY